MAVSANEKKQERLAMTPERWQQVRTVLEGALPLASEQRRVYLDQACSSDQSLRREVESLLAVDEQARTTFLQSRPTSIQFEKGSRLGDFEVESLIGAGGMGEVYRARDLRLKRAVAIKVLPALLSSDAERLRRFEQEANATAALNHPNILAIYQMGVHEGAPYLVSELLEGETLREQLRRGRIATRKSLDYAIQIAHGLAAAHSRGIVHRDLKPENLFITREGRAKILDLGLAKLTQREPLPGAPTMSEGTEPGLVMGTVGYMAPEQVRAQSADHRADIFAMGAILYEMLSGQRAFRKVSAAETMSAIVNEDPPPLSQVSPQLPLALQRILHRCLEKNPEQRFQSASDLAFALQALSDSSGSSSRTFSQPRIAGSFVARKKSIAVGVAVALAALLASFAAYFGSVSNTSDDRSPKITQISQWNRPMNSARLSPDGHAVAFVSPVNGVAEVFLMLTSGGEPLQLTNDEGDKVVESFSSDSREVYYRRFLDRDEIWAVPALGGSPRRVAWARYLVPSLDGSSIYYAKSDSSQIFHAEKSGLNERAVYTSEENGVQFFPLLLFPGGKDLLTASRRGSSSSSYFRIHRIDLGSHKVMDLGEVSGNILETVWGQPGKTILFSRTVEGLTNVWEYSLQRRNLKQITSGAGPNYSPMPEPGGKGIYFVNGKSNGSLSVYNVHSKTMTDIMSGDATQPIISPDGKRVMYVTILSKDRNELWVSDINGSNRLKLATGTALWSGDWAVDNFHLSFCETQADGAAENYIIAADGTGQRRLPSLGNGPMNTIWSPDQHSIYVSGTQKESSTDTIWKVDLENFKTEKVVEDCGAATDIDASGKYLLSMIFAGEKMGIHEVSLPDRKCTFLGPAKTFAGIFARDSKSFLYQVASRSDVTIFRQSWTNGRAAGAPQVALRVPFAFTLWYDTNASDYSRDLSNVVFARPSSNADLYLLSHD